MVLLLAQSTPLLCEKSKKLSNALSESLYFSRRSIEEREIFVISKTKPKTKTFSKRVSEGDLKNNLLEYNPEFLFYLEEAREEYLKLGGLSINEYLERRKT